MALTDWLSVSPKAGVSFFAPSSVEPRSHAETAKIPRTQMIAFANDGLMGQPYYPPLGRFTLRR